MKVKIISWSRKTGVYKGNDYDIITLYGVSLSKTYEKDNTVLQGFPVVFHKIPIRARSWYDVCSNLELSEDNLNHLVGAMCNVSFVVTNYGGKFGTRVDSLDVVERGGDNA